MRDDLGDIITGCIEMAIQLVTETIYDRPIYQRCFFRSEYRCEAGFCVITYHSVWHSAVGATGRLLSITSGPAGDTHERTLRFRPIANNHRSGKMPL